MNVNGFSIRVLSVPVNGDTRERNITGYAITDDEDHIVAEFATQALVYAAWDMIVNESESDEQPVDNTALMPWRFDDGDARPAL
jgi:hypothetical protein